MEKDQERPPDAAKGSFSERRSLAMARSFKNAVVQSAIEPIVSLKSVRVNRESGGKLLAFAIKMVALEIVRRHTHIRFPLVWGCIQSLPLLQLPLFSWLHHWGPLNYLLIGSQAFSRPIMFLSLATTINDKLGELRSMEEPAASTLNDDASVADSEAIGPLALVTTHIEREEETAESHEYIPDGLELLKRELEESRVPLPERIGDDELKRFLLAANNDLKKCAALIKRNIRWRETFYFFPQYEMDKWSALVFWHGYDVHMRPSLVVRIGWAYSILQPRDRPRFAQAVLSQVEYGITHLLRTEDPRITVILDCEGTPALGFPINMLKSCCARVQENYPTRLAALFVVNLPPVVRVIAQAIIQVLKPATKRKIFVEGDQHNALTEHYGSLDSMPIFLGGSCACSSCNKALTSDGVRLQLIDKEQASDGDEDDHDNGLSNEELSNFYRYNSLLRAIIVGFLILWVVVSLLAGFFDPEADFIPT
ncbi:hypothetical protein GOP47_0000255 [Adiantum capillus-veneris]|uniref:CRAL-TRIO domain-containing protein n=1 Tax=Adiantum capillus-veneris TaxID=13818 RepID=A0A9D4ZS74_ADICA|nr:hypothetical protein GOP47_0000255 [Adiantum capillus-veneris]